MVDLVIHVGIRKSATTWLQDSFFDRHPSVNYIGKTTNYYPQWLIDLHYMDDFEFSRHRRDIQKSLMAELRDDSVNLLSSEAFTNTAVIWQQAHRISEIFPRARILITIRDPIDTLISHYKLDVAEGRYHFPLEDYLDWSRTPYDLVKRKPIFLPDFFYNEMIELYRDLFGAHNVCTLRYEDMVSSPDDYFYSMHSFLGLEGHQFFVPSLDQKKNAGAENPLVRIDRAKNAYEILQTRYPNVLSLVGVDDFLSDIEEEIVSDTLRSRFQSYFQGKCYGYY
jgi:hypothetical protein